MEVTKLMIGLATVNKTSGLLSYRSLVPFGTIGGGTPYCSHFWQRSSSGSVVLFKSSFTASRRGSGIMSRCWAVEGTTGSHEFPTVCNSLLVRDAWLQLGLSWRRGETLVLSRGMASGSMLLIRVCIMFLNFWLRRRLALQPMRQSTILSDFRLEFVEVYKSKEMFSE